MRGIGIWILGVIIGAGGLWIAAHFAHIPGIKATSTTTTTNQSSPNININNRQRNITSANSKALVSGFPANVPIYEPSTLALSTKTTRGNSTVSYSASYTSTDQASTIIQYYKSQLNDKGWHIDSENNAGSVTTLKASGNDEQLNVLVGQMTGQSTGAASVNAGFQIAVTPNF